MLTRTPDHARPHCTGWWEYRYAVVEQADGHLVFCTGVVCSGCGVAAPFDTPADAEPFEAENRAGYALLRLAAPHPKPR